MKGGDGVKFLKGVLIALCLVIFVLILMLIDKFGKIETAPKEKTEEPVINVIEEVETPVFSESDDNREEIPSETSGMTPEELRVYSEGMLDLLAYSAGDEGTMGKAENLLTELERNNEEDLYKLLSAVLAFGKGEGDSEKLAEVYKTANKKTVKQAAVSCWAASQNTEETAVFSFVGDCTFARFNEQKRPGGFPALYDKSGSVTYPFDNVRGVFAADDISAVNFEGVLTDSAKHEEKQYYFRGDADYAKILSFSSVEAANLANNHTLDYFETGFEDTVKALEDQKIGLFWASEPYVRSLRTDSGTVSVVMLSTSSIDIKNHAKFAALKKQIERYDSPGTIVIVNLHWGTERAVKPSQWQVETAYELVDAGADLIVGHHPHVLQGIEKYKGVYIAYSLGNFAFGGNSMANRPETMILRAVFDIDSGEVGKCRISAVPCLSTSSGTAVNDYKPSLCFGKKGQDVIDLILSRSAMLENGITELEWHGIDD